MCQVIFVLFFEFFIYDLANKEMRLELARSLVIVFLFRRLCQRRGSKQVTTLAHLASVHRRYCFRLMCLLLAVPMVMSIDLLNAPVQVNSNQVHETQHTHTHTICVPSYTSANLSSASHSFFFIYGKNN